MEDLKETIADFIDTIYDPLKKELNFIEKHDWTKAVTLKNRENEHGLNAIVTGRAVKAAKDLFKIAEADLGHKRVKSLMKLCKEVFDLYERRYNAYTKSQDWEQFMSEGGSLEKVQDEMRFQNDIRNQLNELKKTMRDINFGDEEGRIAISTFNDVPLPLVMREMVEERFPEVKELINKKLENVTTKAKRGRK